MRQEVSNFLYFSHLCDSHSTIQPFCWHFRPFFVDKVTFFRDINRVGICFPGADDPNLIKSICSRFPQHDCDLIFWAEYSQTWANDNLWIATTCLKQILFWSANLCFYYINQPLNIDHLSTMTTNFGPREWSLYTGLTVLKTFLWHICWCKCAKTDQTSEVSCKYAVKCKYKYG